MDTPSRIEALQFALGCTQAEVAERLGIGLSMFHYIRKGERNPSRKVMAKLEAAERQAGIGPAEELPVGRPERSPALSGAEEEEGEGREGDGGEAGDQELPECAGVRFDRIEKMLEEMGEQLLGRIKGLEREIQDLKTQDTRKPRDTKL